MINWKYIDTTNQTVYRIFDDNRSESCLVEAISDWIKEGNAPLPADLPTVDELALQAVVVAKQAKVESLDRITVTTTAGNTFDGRDKDQLRMLAALQSSQFLGLFNTPWKLSDNSVIQVSVEELREALALSIQEIGKIIVGGAS